MVTKIGSTPSVQAPTPTHASERTAHLAEAMQVLQHTVKESPEKYYQANNEFEQSVRKGMTSASPAAQKVLNALVQYNHDGALAVLKEATTASTRMDAGGKVDGGSLSLGAKLVLSLLDGGPQAAPAGGWRPR